MVWDPLELVKPWGTMSWINCTTIVPTIFAPLMPNVMPWIPLHSFALPLFPSSTSIIGDPRVFVLFRVPQIQDTACELQHAKTLAPIPITATPVPVMKHPRRDASANPDITLIRMAMLKDLNLFVDFWMTVDVRVGTEATIHVRHCR